VTSRTVDHVSGSFLAPSEWYASLPTVFVSASVVLTDGSDRVLIVKPNYRDGWAFPGGIIEEGEAPHVCAEREALEEVGLAVTAGRLLVVDFLPVLDDRPRAILNFLFDGGTVADPSAIRVQEEELDAAELCSWDDAAKRFPSLTARRVPAARKARESGRTIYLPTDPS
jgi:8-oxo-dGTP pyrophosphatase MutT (NUDIX family)